MILSKCAYAAAIDKMVFPGIQGGPLVHIIAAKAVCFQEAMQPAFKDYARQTIANAKVLAETLTKEGFRIISGGTDTHLMLVDVFSRGMLGSEAEKALGEAGITVNKNAIPFDTNPPLKPSGIRIGCPAMTTRGRKEADIGPMGRVIAGAGSGIWEGEAEGQSKPPSSAVEFLQFLSQYRLCLLIHTLSLSRGTVIAHEMQLSFLADSVPYQERGARWEESSLHVTV